MSIYIAHSRNNASNALNVPNTDQKDTSSVYDENSQLHVRLTQIVLEQVPCRWSSNSEGAIGLNTCYSAIYTSQTRDQQHFTTSEVAADWHKPMVPQHIMWR